MRIDVRNRKAVIANTMGGFSGAAVFPVAVRMVYQVAKACKIPVMGCGGVTTARDVIEMMMAGATAVQVGAANHDGYLYGGGLTLGHQWILNKRWSIEAALSYCAASNK